MYHHEQLPVPSVRKVGLCFLIVIMSHQHSDVMFDGDRRQGFDFSSKPVRAPLAQRPQSDPLSAPEAYDRAGDAARPPQCPPNTRVWKEQHQRLQPKAQGVHERKGVDDVKPNGPQGASVFCDNDVVIVGIGDAAAAWRGAV
jgi:hypothetical protein